MLRSWEYLETSPDLAAVTGAHYLLSNESKTFKKMKYGMFQLDQVGSHSQNNGQTAQYYLYMCKNKCSYGEKVFFCLTLQDFENRQLIKIYNNDSLMVFERNLRGELLTIGRDKTACKQQTQMSNSFMKCFVYHQFGPIIIWSFQLSFYCLNCGI